MTIACIIATDRNGAIGKDNDIPWQMPADLKYFKKTTMSYPIVMGRKCYESIGRALPGRVNVVVTRQLEYQAKGCIVVHSIDEAYQQLVADGHDQIFIIGGAEIYRQTESHWDKYFLTQVHTEVKGADTHFELAHPDEWELVSSTDRLADERNPYDCTFLIYERRKRK